MNRKLGNFHLDSNKALRTNELFEFVLSLHNHWTTHSHHLWSEWRRCWVLPLWHSTLHLKSQGQIKFCNKDLIKLQHIITNNGKVLKCWCSVWCEHKVIHCVYSITPTRLCMERAKQYISFGYFVQSIHKIVRVTWALPKILSPNNGEGTLTNALSMMASKVNP